MENTDTLPTLSVSRILARGLSIYGRNFLMFTIVGIVAYAPMIGFFALVLEGVIEYSTTMIVFSSVGIIVLESIVTLVLCRAAWDALSGREASFARSFRAARPRLLAGLGTGLLVGVAVVAGTLFFVVPGIMVLVLTWVALPVCLVEKKGPMASFNRSRELLRGYGWQIFGLVFILALGDQFPDKIMEAMVNEGQLSLGTYLLVTLGLSAFLAPIRASLIAVAYDDARELYKDRDIEALASVFGDDVDLKGEGGASGVRPDPYNADDSDSEYR